MPDCPFCGDNRQVYEHGDRNFWCRRCNREFDDDPEEGGDYSDFDPAWRMERQERRRKRRAKR
jgi:transposase-like protein